MGGIAVLFRSTIGKKIVMAATGVILVGFVVVHMLGNLKVFDPHAAEKLSHYAAFLREFLSPALGYEGFLWVARVVLLAAVGLHIWAAVGLTRLSRAARPVGYKRHENIAPNYAARTMRWGGVIIAAFVVYHILHFTTGQAHPEFQHHANGYYPVYENIVAGFSRWPAAVAYIVANVFLGLHLFHGVWSGFQTLGLRSNKRDRALRGVAAVIAIAVAGGNISIPVAVLSGIVK